MVVVLYRSGSGGMPGPVTAGSLLVLAALNGSCYAPCHVAQCDGWLVLAAFARDKINLSALSELHAHVRVKVHVGVSHARAEVCVDAADAQTQTQTQTRTRAHTHRCCKRGHSDKRVHTAQPAAWLAYKYTGGPPPNVQADSHSQKQHSHASRLVPCLRARAPMRYHNQLCVAMHTCAHICTWHVGSTSSTHVRWMRRGHQTGPGPGIEIVVHPNM